MTEKLPVVARISRRTRPLLVAWLWSREKGESRLPLGQRLSWRARSLTHTALSLASSKPLPHSSLDYQTLSVCFTLRPNSGAEGSRFGMWRNPATRALERRECSVVVSPRVLPASPELRVSAAPRAPLASARTLPASLRCAFSPAGGRVRGAASPAPGCPSPIAAGSLFVSVGQEPE